MGRMPWATRRVDRNHSCQRPSHFVFVDTETHWDRHQDKDGRTRHSFRLGVATSVVWPQGEPRAYDTLEFTDIDTFWQWLKTKQVEKRSLWVVGHNLAFDFTILRGWDRLETCEYRIRTDGKSYTDPRTGKERVSAEWQGLVAIDGFPFHIETQGEVGRVNFSDLMNYYRCSLADVGKTVGMDKGERPDAKMPDEWWFAYCRQDVAILTAAYLKLLEQWQDENCGNWSLSGPGLSWNNYRHRHMATPVVLHSHGEARDLEWAAYHPGECRAWFRGACAGPVIHYDVNSLYPAMMLGREFPMELVDFILTPKPGMVEWLLGKFLVIAEVDIESWRSETPFRRAGRTLYPVGRFTTALAGPELFRAWTRGEVRAVRRLAYYRGARLFDSFVGHWWTRRREALHSGRAAGSGFAKLMMNALPGKFSQRNPAWRFDPRIDVVRPWRSFPWRNPDNGQLYNARAIGWEGQYAAFRDDAANCFPAIGAYLTSYAREFMRELRSCVPPSHLYYQDTDSLMMNVRGLGRVEDLADHVGDGLGQLRVVGNYNQVTIRGPKNYTCDGVHTIAGVKLSDDECGPMMWSGTRWEGTGQIVTREPDGTVRTWRHSFDTPGTCLEGGYAADGWSYPVEIS